MLGDSHFYWSSECILHWVSLCGLPFWKVSLWTASLYRVSSRLTITCFDTSNKKRISLASDFQLQVKSKSNSAKKVKKMNFWLKLLLAASALLGCFEVCSGQCFTNDERGPKTPCVFPFIQSGKTYTKCTTDGDEDKKFWHQWYKTFLFSFTRGCIFSLMCDPSMNELWAT